MKTWLITTSVLAGLGLGGWLLLRKQLRAKQTQRKATEARQASNSPKGIALEEPNWHDPFDMEYSSSVSNWLAPRDIVTADQEESDGLARKLKTAKGLGFFSNDDEAVVENIFGKRLRDKVAVSAVAAAFYHRYQEDLWEHLQSFLSESELETYIRRHIRRMPNYRLV